MISLRSYILILLALLAIVLALPAAGCNGPDGSAKLTSVHNISLVTPEPHSDTHPSMGDCCGYCAHACCGLPVLGFQAMHHFHTANNVVLSIPILAGHENELIRPPRA